MKRVPCGAQRPVKKYRERKRGRDRGLKLKTVKNKDRGIRLTRMTVRKVISTTT